MSRKLTENDKIALKILGKPVKEDLAHSVQNNTNQILNSSSISSSTSIITKNDDSKDSSNLSNLSNSSDLSDLSESQKQITILQYLKQMNSEVKTVELSKHIYGKSATRKMINPMIYKMSTQQLVEKIADENGVNPRWKITDKGKNFLSSVEMSEVNNVQNISQNNLQNRTLNIIKPPTLEELEFDKLKL